MSLGSTNCASHWLSCVLAVVSAWGCSDKGSPHAGSTPTSGTTTAHATVTASSTASSSGSSASHTASGGAPTTSSTTSSGSGGSNSGSSASDGGGLGGEAGADTSGGTTAGPSETVEGDRCSFTLSHRASEAIGTVQIVTWSTDLPNVNEARLEFGLTGSELEMSAPVDLAEPDFRTLLLGMKGARSYSFRILASSAATTCTSPELSFMTGPVPEWVPSITKSGSGTNASKGFIITTSGLNFFSMSANRELPSVYIFDTDGDVVWWTTNEIEDISSARMSWDGKTMFSVCAYRAWVFGVSMDGMVAQEYRELEGANHDLAVLPDGGIATMLTGNPSSFAEMKADGSVVTIVPDLANLFGDETLHPNAVHYHQADDTFTLSNLTTSSIVKFTRTGDLVWQIGGNTPLGDSFELVGVESWNDNHGHHLTADGHFLIFNNRVPDGETSRSRVLEVLLDDEEWTATKTWEFSEEGWATAQLGDVQRLPNGNVLVTYSNVAQIVEVAPSGEVVQSFENDRTWLEGYSWPFALFGYATFRTSLYGPPPR